MLKMLTTKVDGRTTRGMKRAQARLDAEGHIDAIPLRNYIAKVEVAEVLYKNSLTNYSDAELHQMLASIEAEGTPLPGTIQAKVVERFAQQKLSSQQWKPLVEAIFPFSSDKWSATKPSVAAVDADAGAKYATWEAICLRRVLPPLLLKEADGRKAVEDLAKIVLSKLEKVDAVELCLLGAATMCNAETIFTCLLALAEEQLDVEKQAFKERQKDRGGERETEINIGRCTQN